MRRNGKKWYIVRVKCQFAKLWDLSGYSEKSNTQEAYLPKKLAFWGKLSLMTHIQILAVSNKSNKTNNEKKNSLFFLNLINQFIIFFNIRLQKQHDSRTYWLKICKAWVRRQLRWAWNWLKLNVTSSNVLRIIIHWLSARRDVGLTQGSLTPKEHSLYRALKHSIHQHKLDLNFE